MTDRQRVARAARLMDKLSPGWFKKIRLYRLNLRDPDECICGQAGLRWIEIAPGDQDFGTVTSDNSYKSLWWDEVRKRRAKKVPA